MSDQNDPGALETIKIIDIEVEFNRPIDVTTIPAKGRRYKFEATDEELQALTVRYGVESLSELRAECHIKPARKGAFKLTASFDVDIVQACGISLEPVTETISGEFSLDLKQPPRPGVHQKPRKETEIEFDFDEEDSEILTSNLIDVGEMIAQHLSLEINPYPRSSKATGEELGQKIIQEEEFVEGKDKVNPFNVLKSMKHKT